MSKPTWEKDGQGLLLDEYHPYQFLDCFQVIDWCGHTLSCVLSKNLQKHKVHHYLNNFVGP